MKIYHWILFHTSVWMMACDSLGQCTPCDSAYRALKADVVYVRFLYGGRFKWDRDVQELYDQCMQQCNLIALLPHLHDSLPIMRTLTFEGIAQKTDQLDLLEAIYNAHHRDSSFVDDTSHEHYSETVKERMHLTLILKQTAQHRPNTNNHMKKPKREASVLNQELWHGGIRLKDLLALDSLTPPIPKAKITSFMLTTSTEGRLDEFEVKENRISDEMKKHLCRMNPGDKVFIENIQVVMPDRGQRKLCPLTIFIH